MDAARWETWRRRLAELRRDLEAHLREADALAAQAQASSSPDHEASEPRPEADIAHTRVTSAGWSPEVARALAHLEGHFDRELTIAKLARVAGCSRDRLARAVRRETGLTIHTHVMRRRLARAARDVRAGDKIEAVMLSVGYRGKRNFYRQFKARFGMTPGRWRDSVEGEE